MSPLPYSSAELMIINAARLMAMSFSSASDSPT